MLRGERIIGMAESLSIPNLLSLLQVDRQHEAMILAEEAERISRSRAGLNSAITALALANSAVEIIAKDISDLRGAALLYRAYVRTGLHDDNQYDEAVRDCNRAVRHYCSVPHNRALGLVIRALIRLETGCEDRFERSLADLLKAKVVLETMLQESRLHNQHDEVAFYEHLQAKTMRQVAHVRAQLDPDSLADDGGRVQPTDEPRTMSGGARTLVASEAAEHLEHREFSHRFPIPLPLDLPRSESVGLRIYPPSAGTLPAQVEISHLIIGRRRFDVEPVEGAGALRLRTRQSYQAIPLKGQNNNQYALIRRQDRPDKDQQYVVVDDPVRHETWIDEARFLPPFRQIHIIGANRKWDLSATAGTAINIHIIGDIPPRIIGVVEAILTPYDS
jgi:hypothetical protein